MQLWMWWMLVQDPWTASGDKVVFVNAAFGAGQGAPVWIFAVQAAQKTKVTAAPKYSPLKATLPCTVGVVGAGLMGSGIVFVLLQAGYSVFVEHLNSID